MSIDLTKTLEALQRKINSFDSTGDEYDLKYLLKAALRGERSTVYTYATEDDLPNLLDDSAGGFENEMLVYAKDSKQFYFQDFQNKLWKPLNSNIPDYVGDAYAYWGGGQTAPNEATSGRYVDRLSVSSETVDTNWTQLTGGRYSGGSTTSGTSGYQIGGLFFPAANFGTRKFQKFNFTTGTATGLTDLSKNNQNSADASSIPYGYGWVTSSDTPGQRDDKDKHPFASDTPFSISGTLTVEIALYNRAGLHSDQKGYIASGWQPSPLIYSTQIQSFPMANDDNSSEITADLVRAHSGGEGVGGPDGYGYVIGGYDAIPPTKVENERFPFANENISVA